jgi:hypothetical protein
MTALLIGYARYPGNETCPAWLLSQLMGVSVRKSFGY